MNVKVIMGVLMVILIGVSAADAQEKKPGVDWLNPTAVAKAFVTALANERMDEAIEYVILEDREDFREEVMKGVPKLPKNPEVIVMLEKDGKRAGVNLSNHKPRNRKGPPFGFNMELVDGKWWIVK